MTGKILIYGGTGGIGSETARALTGRGHAVHVVGRSPEKAAALAEATGCTYSIADIADPESFARVVEEAGSPLAGLIYAIGTINLKPLARFKEEDFLADFRINALGAALATQAALPSLKAYDGTAAILFFSTVAVGQGFPSHTSIAMAKGAVEGLARSLAAELAPGIRVNAIAPSLTETPLAKALVAQPAMAQALGQLHPLGRLGQPSDIAHLAAFLMSPEANWITGQVIGVDGGRSSLRTKG
jgi:NAD(P)-dependent dehydrogenase (short-subunit alcohol dehydrogenase family)